MTDKQMTIKDYVYAPAVQEKFLEVATAEMKDNYSREALFAMQQLNKNDFSMGVAKNSPTSVQNAVINIATVGLSLNPANRHAYLVPRDRMICLDISYLGLKFLAESTGAVTRVDAELVYEKDTIEVVDIESKPIHKYSPFGNRGSIIGIYCVASLPNGKYKSCFMTKAEIDDVKKCSKAQNGPWKNFYQEMAKKTVIKRASKLWPTTSQRLNHAIHTVNEHEGLEIEITPPENEKKQARLEQQKRDDNLASEKVNILEQIKELSKQATDGLDQAAKLAFMESVLGVNDFKKLSHFTNEALILLKKEVEIILLDNQND